MVEADVYRVLHHRIRLKLEETEGIALDVEFTGRAFPIEEPRFTRRQGPRMLMDVTRMTQNGRWSGNIRVDGQESASQGDDLFRLGEELVGVNPLSVQRVIAFEVIGFLNSLSAGPSRQDSLHLKDSTSMTRWHRLERRRALDLMGQ